MTALRYHIVRLYDGEGRNSGKIVLNGKRKTQALINGFKLNGQTLQSFESRERRKEKYGLGTD